VTAPKLHPRHEADAIAVARAIGAAFRSARIARGDRQQDISTYFEFRPNGNISMFERGTSPNLMVSTAIRNLSVYGLTLAVVPQTGEAWPSSDCLAGWVRSLSEQLAAMRAALPSVRHEEVSGELTRRCDRLADLVAWLNGLRVDVPLHQRARRVRRQHGES
jgi:hypothetical protein